MGKNKRQKSIIHIVGCGRSGSTIVDRTLGHHSRAFSIGEILNFREDYLRNSLCGCGRVIQECAFWGAVLGNLSAQTGSALPDFVGDFPLKPEPYTGLNKKLHRVKNAAGLFLRLPPKLFADVNIYENTARLYEEVFALSEAPIIVDSSKGIVRALFLSRFLPQYEHFFIHLIRDGRGVVHSKLKKSYQVTLKVANGELEKKEFESTQSVSPEAAVDDWVKVNLKTERVIRSYGLAKRAQRLHFEELLKAPAETLTRVLNRIGLAFEPDMLNFSFGDNHMVCGNAARLNALKLRNDDRDWNAILDPNLLAIFNARGGGKLNKKYGYQ